MARTGIDPTGRVSRSDSPTDLHPARPCCKGLFRGGLIAFPEHDHMSAGQPVVAESFREPCGRLFGYEILLRSGAVVTQAASDDLFHLPLMEVDAGAEAAAHFEVTITPPPQPWQEEG